MLLRPTRKPAAVGGLAQGRAEKATWETAVEASGRMRRSSHPAYAAVCLVACIPVAFIGFRTVLENPLERSSSSPQLISINEFN
jgi:hypothetical protein